MGDIRLRIAKEASICSKIVEDEYHKDLGARSLIAGVNRISEKVNEAYLGILDDDVKEGSDVLDMLVTLNGDEIDAMVIPRGQGGTDEG